jgi:hypothetical protein
MKRNLSLILTVVVLAAVLQGCAVLRPGADQFLTRAEQSYDVAFWSVDALFRVEKVTPELDKLVPGSHAVIDRMRVDAPVVFVSAMNALDAYRANPTEAGKTRITQTLAVATSLAQDASSWLAKINTAKGGK